MTCWEKKSRYGIRSNEFELFYVDYEKIEILAVEGECPLGSFWRLITWCLTKNLNFTGKFSKSALCKITTGRKWVLFLVHPEDSWFKLCPSLPKMKNISRAITLNINKEIFVSLLHNDQSDRDSYWSAKLLNGCLKLFRECITWSMT